MTESFVNAELNRVLVVLRRSLLQYMGECWPWTDPRHQAVRERFDRLISRQEANIASLVEQLIRRGWHVDFGVFPTEFTDLHYVALDFLLTQAIKNQQAAVAEVQAGLAACAGDPEAFAHLQHIAAVERDNLDELKAMAASGNVAAGTVPPGR